MKWTRDPILDTIECKTESGRYLCVRTWADTSKLYFDGVLIGAWNTGSHTDAMKFAEVHYASKTSNE